MISARDKKIESLETEAKALREQVKQLKEWILELKSRMDDDFCKDSGLDKLLKDAR